LLDPSEDDRQGRGAVTLRPLNGNYNGRLALWQHELLHRKNMTADSAQFAGKGVASDDDLDLVHASQNGDVSAFEQLVKRYDRKLLRIAQGVTHNTEDSQDAVQEALLKAFQNLGQFREQSQFSTWLIRITLNQSLMKLRKQRSIREVSLDEHFQADGNMLPMEVTDWAPNPEQLYSASELRDILVKTLKDLRPILRMVFVLRDIEGFSIDQTSEVLNLSHSAVKARLWRARLQLRERLTKYFSKQTTSAYGESVPGRDSAEERRLPGEACISGSARIDLCRLFRKQILFTHLTIEQANDFLNFQL
jgi:RNA polymerase sigma-70 factor (ECF subfamily)